MFDNIVECLKLMPVEPSEIYSMVGACCKHMCPLGHPTPVDNSTTRNESPEANPFFLFYEQGL